MFAAGACGPVFLAPASLRQRCDQQVQWCNVSESFAVTVLNALLHCAYHFRLAEKLNRVLNGLTVRFEELRTAVLRRQPICVLCPLLCLGSSHLTLWQFGRPTLMPLATEGHLFLNIVMIVSSFWVCLGRLKNRRCVLEQWTQSLLMELVTQSHS